MSQITWRNIDAPDLSGVGRLQLAGNQNIRDAISGLIAPIQQNQALSNINFNTARTQNTAALQNKLLGYQDPNALQQALPQFNADALRDRFGAAVDQSAINQTLATRPGQLRQDATGQIQLENLQKDQASQPFENQFYSLLAANPDQAEQFLRQNQDNFADSRQLYGDLTNRRQQIEQLGLQRAQLADSRAARASAQSDRAAAQSERKNLTTYAQELNQWVLDNPDKPVGAKAAELQKQYNINPVTGNQVATAVGQNIQTLGAPTGQQTAIIGSASAANQQANEQYKQDVTQEVNDAFLKSGIDPTVYSLQDDKKTSADDVIKSLQARLSDSNEATEAYTRIKKAYPGATPATVGYIIEKSLSPNTFTDGVSISFGDVEKNAQQARKTANDSASRQALTDALRLVDSSSNQLLKESNAPLAEFQRNIPKANITGQPLQAPQLTVPDYTKSREEIRKLLQDRLGNPKVNTSTTK
jgi:hypothetical protein